MTRVFLTFGLIFTLLAGCSTSRREYDKTQSFAPRPSQNSTLARDAHRLGDLGDGRSGVRVISDGEQALAARLLLAANAEVSIDAQYYLLHDDPTGHLFSWSLLQAADRGVRVRLLLDDRDTKHYDAMTAALDTHENVEIRLFNPYFRDEGLVLTGLSDFNRVNRRMHNKSMIADNAISIVGGRNIGDEYFQAKAEMNYADLDVLVAGPVVREVSDAFDAYWNSEFALPARAVIGEPDGFGLADARTRLKELATEASETRYADVVRQAAAENFTRDTLKLEWVPARMYADPPSKAAGAETGEPVLASRLSPYFAAAKNEISIISAYFVPRARGVKWLSKLEERGVDVRVVTNSLKSNDVAPVYAHYAKKRRALLRGGVELYEMRPDADRIRQEGVHWGQSRSGLHSKAFAIDDRYLFIGSFNWDPRSVNINTEMGILIDSPAVTGQAMAALEDALVEQAFAVELDDNNRLTWRAHDTSGAAVRYNSEPTGSLWDHIVAGFLALAPIGAQL